MNPVKIPVTLSPHYSKDKPRGFYVLAQRLFTNGTPHLVRKQFVGYAEGAGLVISTGRNIKWNSLLKMGLHVPHLEVERQKRVIWLASVPIYPIPMGFRCYLPGTIMKPNSAEKIETVGWFKRFQIGTTDLFYLEIPKITMGDLE